MNLNIQARLFAAIGQFKATSDIRFYLNGIYVEPLPEGGAVIVATNGHCMGVWRDKSGTVERAAILSAGKPLLSACAGSEEKRLQLVEGRLTVIDKTGAEIYVQNKVGVRGNGWEIDGKFPVWRDVIPDFPDGEGSLFDPCNPGHLALAQKAIEIGLKDRRTYAGVAIRQPARGKAAVLTASMCLDFIGVVMPMREDVAPVPVWSKKPAEVKTPEVAEAA